MGILATMVDNCITKAITSNVKSLEEQDGGKQYFVGQTTAELQAVFMQKHGKETKIKDFNIVKEGKFSCKL